MKKKGPMVMIGLGAGKPEDDEEEKEGSGSDSYGLLAGEMATALEEGNTDDFASALKEFILLCTEDKADDGDY